MTDVFISYSRKDKAFVQVLNQALVSSKYDAWVDWENIPLTADWWEEIKAGIEGADTFIFVISPDSIASEICDQEIDHAVASNKRLVPIVYREGFDMALVHPTLSKTNWLFFRDQDEFDIAFRQLVETLNTDLEYVKTHTRLLVRAIEWEQKNKIEDILLRGNEAELAINWLQEAIVAAQQPTPTTLQAAFIRASQELRDRMRKQEQERQRRELRRTRWLALGAIGAGVMMAGLTSFALDQKSQVEIVQESQINALSRYSLSLTNSDQTFDGLLEALRAGQQLRLQLGRVNQKTRSNVLTALQASVYEKGWREHNRLSGHTNDVNRLAISPNGQIIASASRDQTIRLWDMQGDLRRTLNKHQQSVTGVTFSPDGQMLASTSADKTVKLWKRDGTLINSFDFEDETKDVAFHPDGDMLAVASYQLVQLVTLDGEIIRRIPHENWVNSVEFSPDGKTVLTSTEQSAHQWTLAGEKVESFPDQNWVNMARFRPTPHTNQEPLIASAGDQAVHLWTLKGTKRDTLVHENWVNSVRFSPDGTQVVTASSAKQITLWDLENNTHQQFPQERDMVDAVFSPDGKTLVFASRDRTIQVWRKGEDLFDSPLYKGLVNQLQFNADGSRVATMTGATLRLWTPDGQLVNIQEFEQSLTDFSFGNLQRQSGERGEEIIAIASGNQIHLQTMDGTILETWDYPHPVTSVDMNATGTMLLVAGDSEVYLVSSAGKILKRMSELDLPNVIASTIRDIQFSPTGQHVAIRTQNQTVYLWDLEREALTTLAHNDIVNDISFSPNPNGILSRVEQFLASGGNDNTLRLWAINGTLKNEHFSETAIIHVRFSPDGKLLVTVDADHSIHLWRINQDRLLPMISLLGHTNSIGSIEFSPDSTHLVSAGADEQVIAWNLADLTLGQLMENACQIVENYLTTNSSSGKKDSYLCEKV
ncbi:MAG: TIR domain-containing protein [Cyanobacteria bacterium P01_F01_bin.116]